MSKPLKVVFMGAASPQWGYKIARDLIVALSDNKICEQYSPTLVLEDIDQANLAKMERLAQKVSELCGQRIKIESTTDQKKALEGCHFNVVSIAVGTLEAMRYDLDVPKEYGIYQTVGDSISIGGAIRATRNIPAMVSIAKDMEKLAAPGAWMLNLTNPMSILTRAVTKESKVNTIGVCHELYNGTKVLARFLGFPYEMWRQRMRPQVLGINHCGWMYECLLDGQDALEQFRLKLKEAGITGEVKQLYNSEMPEFRRQNVKINLFMRHGVLPYSGDRHTAEFFSEFLNADTNQGADYGLMLTTPQARMVEWRGRAREEIINLINGSQSIDLNMSEEAAARIITAIALDDKFYDTSNMPYTGNDLPGIPQGAVIERMTIYDGAGAHPQPVKPLPQPVMEHTALIAQNIEKIVTASLEGNKQLLVEALTNDPLMKNLDAAKIPALVDKLLDIHKESVHPGFFA